MELLNAKGDNITLILDCCHVAGMNRGANDPAQQSWTLYFKNVQDLSPTCNEHIYSHESRTRSFQDRESGFSGSYLGSHILLAACRCAQTAWEEGDNGLFMTALLSSLKDATSRDLPPTYASLMKCLPKLENQMPHWDGKHVHRFLFDSWQVPAGCSAIPCYRGSDWPDNLILQAGSLHGITVGSTFEIFRSPFSHPNINNHVAILMVTEVKQSISRLLPTSSKSTGSALNSGFWYARLRKASNDFPFFESTLMAHAVCIKNPDDVDICLTVKGNMVHFNQGKRASGRIKFSSYFPPYSPCPVLAMPDIQNFINHYAHFTSCLVIKSPHATMDFVTITMNKLRTPRKGIPEADGKVGLATVKDGELFEITINTSMKYRDCYGFTIIHKGGVDLYTYLLYFDASKLTIGMFNFANPFSQN
ncbi:hypothetical protein F5146DRAFT_1141058 [Armillaria mellea]|nr:hypothetical protein F5146DRAFT_1141058 [Armillaria mellea]